MTGVKCNKTGCNGWAKKGTARCVFHPEDASGVVEDVGNLLAQAIPAPAASFSPPKPTAPSTRCNVCRAVIPLGQAGCPQAWTHQPGYTPRGRS